MRNGLLLFICIMATLSVVSFVYAENGLALIFLIIAIIMPIFVVSKILFENNRHILIGVALKLGLLPKPTESYLFVISLSFLALLFFQDFRAATLIFFEVGVVGYIFFIYWIIGLYYSIYFAFSRKEKTEFETSVIKFYLAFSLIVLSITFIYKELEMQKQFYWIFAFWNGTQALALFFSGKKLGEGIPLSSKNAHRIELLFGVVIVTAIILFGKFIYYISWQITLSTILIVWSIVENSFLLFPNIQKSSPIIGNEMQQS